ncbi:MAG: hypothetical protein Q8Q00_01370 [Dehalococcoidia bacterium]|nr:hypothetical protein [Dehalococcoidia bacterium]
MQAKRYALLLALLKAMKDRGSWCGETHVQKASYFLQEATHVPLDLDFILYKHGPYSFDLHEDLGEMRARLLIDIEQRAPYGPSLKQGPSAQVLADGFASAVAAYSPAIDFVAEKLSGHGVVDLERLATALYVIRNYTAEEDKAGLMNALKPHVAKDRAAEAIDEVEKILEQASRLGS